MEKRPIGKINALSLASLIFAVLGIVTMCCIYSGIVFGALAVLFGLLSRGQARRASTQGRIGIVFGALAIFASIFLTVYSYVSLIREYGSLENAMNATYTMFEDMLNVNMDELYQELENQTGK